MNKQIRAKELHPEFHLTRVATEERSVAVADIVWFLKRFRLHLGMLGLVGALAGTAYVAATPSVYTARSQIVIDPKMPVLFSDPGGETRSPLDTGQIANQITVLKSEKIAMMVIERFNLANDREFRAPRVSKASVMESLTERVRTMFGRAAAAEAAEPADQPVSTGGMDFAAARSVLDTFTSRLDVRRSGVAYALDVSFTSHDPEKAALITNAVVDAFVQEKADARMDAVRQGTQWLNDRIEQVRRQMIAATHAVQVFRASHDYRIPRFRPADGTPPGNPLDLSSRPAPQPGEATIEELESSAETLKRSYEGLLGALAEAAQKQSAPVLDSRVVTVATRPLYRSSPRARLVIPLAAFGAMGLGIGLGLAQMLLDGRVRSRSHVRTATGLDCLARVPAEPLRASPKPPGSLKRIFRRAGHGSTMSATDLARPSVAMSDALRWVRIAVSTASQPDAVQTIGFVATDPSVGRLKAKAVLGLARLHAAAGSRTLVIDANVADPAITQAFAPSSEYGLFEVLAGDPGCFERSIIRMHKGCDLLPIGRQGREQGRDLLASPMMDVALNSLLTGYDMVIVDLPSIPEVAETLAVARLLQGVVIVARWAKTPVEMLAEGSRTLDHARARVLGTVLMDVDPTAIES